MLRIYKVKKQKNYFMEAKVCRAHKALYYITVRKQVKPAIIISYKKAMGKKNALNCFAGWYRGGKKAMQFSV